MMEKVRRKYNENDLRLDSSINGGVAYQQCAVSLMDTIRTKIKFDSDGVSNFYWDYLNGAKQNVKEGDSGQMVLEEAVNRMKEDGKGRSYDCVLGVSGGVDSTFMALNAKRWGLRVLCVHFDNGWNSELATENIENIVSKCGFDLYTEVMDWEEFRALQKAYFEAHVIDIEAVTDIGIFAAIDRVLKKFDCSHILDGRNHKTESVLGNWINKNPSNLLNIAQTHGVWPIRKFPLRHSLDIVRISRIAEKRKNHRVLDWIEYNKVEAKKEITAELGWRDYGGKHYESVFTRFYQGYILPEKFGVDKRKAHLSNLIFSGQMSKQEALEEIQYPMYDNDVLKEDFQFVMKKLGFTTSEFYGYIDAPEVPHSHYGLSRSRFKDWRFLRPSDLL